jgi:hypothetical protein
MWATKRYYKHKAKVIGGVVEYAAREGEVVCSIPTGCVATNFMRKVTYDINGDGRVSSKRNIFLLFLNSTYIF